MKHPINMREYPRYTIERLLKERISRTNMDELNDVIEVLYKRRAVIELDCEGINVFKFPDTNDPLIEDVYYLWRVQK